MTPALTQVFAVQAASCAALGSPFMGQMLPLLPAAFEPGSALGQRILAWPEDRLGPSHDSVPLRMAGALHHLHLAGEAPALSDVYPPHDVPDDALAEVLARVLRTHEAAIMKSLDSPPQTNEVRRAAVLIALGHWLTALWAKPLVVSEIGASAGLNLNWDFFCLEAAGLTLGPDASPVRLTPTWHGTPPPVCPAYVADARGVDLRPIDVRDPAQALRLQSYLWPDQADRLARTRAAIALFTQPDTEAGLDAGDAIDWLPGRLAPRAGHGHMLYSTIAWQYLPPAAQAEGTRRIEAAGAAATADAPLAWFRMEADGAKPGAGLSLRLWPGDHRIDMGRVDYHGRWVDWQAPAPRRPLP